jgi:hypothetical protein
MLLKILKMILYFFIIFAKPVYAADNFDTYHDSYDSKYYQTPALGINLLPAKNQIIYDDSLVFGSFTPDVLNEAQISDLVNFNNTTRKDSKFAEIKVPPETKVDLIYVYSNQSSKNVNISLISLMLTATDSSRGDWSKVLSVPETQQGSFSYKYIGIAKTKVGIYKEYTGLGIVNDQQEGTVVLDTLTVKNPLAVTPGLELGNSGNDKVVFNIQNRGDKDQNNIKIKYMGEEQLVNLNALEERKIYFSTTDTVFDKTAQASIENPNYRKECIVNTTTDLGNSNVERNILFASRDEWTLMGIPSVSGTPSFCITQIPYTMFSGSVVNEDFDIQSIRGITDTSVTLTELPKTGIYLYSWKILLVGFSLLCYAIYILRRKYDCKNINTRICPKSSKNAQ